MMRLTQAATLLTGVFLVQIVVPQAGAESTEDARIRYAACMDLVENNAEQAFDEATGWEGLGGGYPARHCALAALMKIGHYGEAAQGFERLADAVHADADFKAKLLVQSAQAWVAADQPKRAVAAVDTALTLTPDIPGAMVLRAQALALQGAFWEAADDLSRVLYTNPQNIEALVMRGAAYRQLDAHDLAMDDLNRALQIAPDHPEGLLERGIVHRLTGHKTKARTDWKRLITTAPDTDAARAAEANLHSLDSGMN